MVKKIINLLLFAALGAVLTDAGCELPFSALSTVDSWTQGHTDMATVLCCFILWGVGLFVSIGLFVLIRRGNPPAWAKNIFFIYSLFIVVCYVVSFHYLGPEELRRWTAEGLLCPILFSLMIWRIKPAEAPLPEAVSHKGARGREKEEKTGFGKMWENENKVNEIVSKHEKLHWLIAAMILFLFVFPKLAIVFLHRPFGIGRAVAGLSIFGSFLSLGIWWFFNPLDLILDRGKGAQVDRLEKAYGLSFSMVITIARGFVLALCGLYAFYGLPLMEDCVGLITGKQDIVGKTAVVSASESGLLGIRWTILFQGDTDNSYDFYYPSDVPVENTQYRFYILKHSQTIVSFDPVLAEK